MEFNNFNDFTFPAPDTDLTVSVTTQPTLVDPFIVVEEPLMAELSSAMACQMIDPALAGSMAEGLPTSQDTCFSAFIDDNATCPTLTRSSTSTLPMSNDSTPEKKESKRMSRSMPACESCSKSKDKCDGEDPCGMCKLRERDCVRNYKESHFKAAKKAQEKAAKEARRQAKRARRVSLATTAGDESEGSPLVPQRCARKTSSARKRRHSTPYPRRFSVSSAVSTPPNEPDSPQSDSNAVVDLHHAGELIDILMHEKMPAARATLQRLRQSKDVVKVIEAFHHHKEANEVTLAPMINPIFTTDGLSVPPLPPIAEVSPTAALGSSIDLSQFLIFSPAASASLGPVSEWLEQEK